MKKITIESSYRFFSKIVPNFILSPLKKTNFYYFIKQKGHEYIPSEYMPSWNEIKVGLLKGRSIFVDPWGSWQNEMISGTYDDFLFQSIKEIDLEGKVVYDIGAHIGFSSLYFATRVGDKGKVLTFEPNSHNVERIRMILKRNDDLEKRIRVFQYAVSNTDGETDFISSRNIENGTSSGSFIQDSDTFLQKSSYEKEGGFERSRVKTITIDSLLKIEKHQDPPHLIKIDIEGAESLALEGMKNLIKEHKPIFLIEIHSIFNMFNVYKRLSESNYQIELLKEEKDGRCFIKAKYVHNQ